MAVKIDIYAVYNEPQVMKYLVLVKSSSGTKGVFG